MTQETTAFRYGNKHKINIVIDPDQLEEVESIAREMRCNRSVVLRQAIDFFLSARREEKQVTA